MTGPVLVLLCGKSFSGKSTHARRIGPELEAEIISLDEITEQRGLQGGQGIPVEEWVRTHELASARAQALLRSGRSVIVDDTSNRRFLRDNWRRLAADSGAEFALVYVEVPDAVLHGRLRANRADPTRHDVTDDILAEHLADFELPQADESPVVVSGDAP